MGGKYVDLLFSVVILLLRSLTAVDTSLLSVVIWLFRSWTFSKMSQLVTLRAVS